MRTRILPLPLPPTPIQMPLTPSTPPHPHIPTPPSPPILPRKPPHQLPPPPINILTILPLPLAIHIHPLPLLTTNLPLLPRPPINLIPTLLRAPRIMLRPTIHAPLPFLRTVAQAQELFECAFAAGGVAEGCFAAGGARGVFERAEGFEVPVEFGGGGWWVPGVILGRGWGGGVGGGGGGGGVVSVSVGDIVGGMRLWLQRVRGDLCSCVGDRESAMAMLCG